MNDKEFVRKLNAKEASYLANTHEFTNFAYSFRISLDAFNSLAAFTSAAKRSLECITKAHPLACCNVAVSAFARALVFRKAKLSDLRVETAPSGSSLDSVLLSEIAIPIQVFHEPLVRIVLVLPTEAEINSEFHHPKNAGVVFTFAHVGFDGTVAAHIITMWLNELLDSGSLNSLSETPQYSQQDVLVLESDMIPTSERTWQKFIRFVLNTLGLLVFIFFKSRPTIIKPSTAAPKSLDQIDKELLLLLRNKQEAKNAQLTLFRSRFLNPEETEKVIQRAKRYGVSVTALICGALATAIACSKLLPQNNSRPPVFLPFSFLIILLDRKKNTISILSALAINGRQARFISPQTDGAFNYILLAPHVSIKIIDENSGEKLVTESHIQADLIKFELDRRLKSNEPLQMARFLPSPAKVFLTWFNKASWVSRIVITPKEAPDFNAVKFSAARLPICYALSNVGRIRSSSMSEILKVSDFRMVCTMRDEGNLRRIEANAVTFNKKMTISLQTLYGMVDAVDLDLLEERLYNILLG
ncbi:hypothetical protein HK100_000212 [Physocladia obscura]|uniref:Alcohol acetyltransferase n=1 Tax=Physocladia obscura TaxID=109957 RepID=A0AAD5SYN8_9FUNG|nr:hypothetical protein HK100_000212 [Physocladia obscura]